MCCTESRLDDADRQCAAVSFDEAIQAGTRRGHGFETRFQQLPLVLVDDLPERFACRLGKRPAVRLVACCEDFGEGGFRVTEMVDVELAVTCFRQQARQDDEAREAPRGARIRAPAQRHLEGDP